MNRLLWSNLVRRCWKGGLGLSLGLIASSASAGEVQWRAAPDARPAAEPPAATILAPVPLPAKSAAPGNFKTVSFDSAAGVSAPVIFRAQMSDGPRMLPVGPEATGTQTTAKLTPMLPAPQVAATPGTGCQQCPPCPCDPCACGTGHPDGCGPLWSHECRPRDSDCFWFSADYLLWWVKGNRLPALVTTGSAAEPPAPGALGQMTTQVLYGNGFVESDPRSGARLRAGWWFDEDHWLGMDVGGFFLGQRTANFFAGSPGTMLIARPFFDVSTGMPNAEAVSFPGAVAGSVGVALSTQVWGAEANLRSSLLRGSCYHIDAIAGFRALGLDEKLTITESPTNISPPLPAGAFLVSDRFTTRNRFYGGQVGLENGLRFGDWSVDVSTKVAFGNVHQTVNIGGNTLITDATGFLSPRTGGLYATPSNIGNYSRDRFAVMPEVGVNIGYQVTDHFRILVGYNILYLSDVARPGEQIDTRVNPVQVPRLNPSGSGPVNPALPAFSFHGTDFWAQGVNVGLEFRW